MTYPIAIIEDRYTGAYSGGKWLAISEADTAHGGYLSRASLCLEEGPHGDDGEAMDFWRDPPPWVAVGNTPDQALRALQSKATGADHDG